MLTSTDVEWGGVGHPQSKIAEDEARAQEAKAKLETAMLETASALAAVRLFSPRRGHAGATRVLTTHANGGARG